jgi:tRNA pseudouridine55 synthase
MLLICFGEATKISPYLLDADKSYRVVCKLGAKTTTGDSEGKVISHRPVKEFSNRDIERVLSRFVGQIEQIPPMYSALKHKGTRLYKLAREGIEVERKPRQVTIYRLRMTDRTSVSLSLEINCTKGTYVRTLIEDIGEALGCGAHVRKLRRMSVGPYADTAMIGMDELSSRAELGYAALDEILAPIDSALTDCPSVLLNGDLAYYARLGQAVLVPGTPSSGVVRLYSDKRLFIGIGNILDDGRVAPKRLIFTE